MKRINSLLAYLITFAVLTSAWWVQYVLPEKKTVKTRYFYPTPKEIQELNAGIW